MWILRSRALSISVVVLLVAGEEDVGHRRCSAMLFVKGVSEIPAEKLIEEGGLVEQVDDEEIRGRLDVNGEKKV